MQWKESCGKRERHRNGADDNDDELSEDKKQALSRDFNALRRVEPRLKPAGKEQYGGVGNDESHGIPQRREQSGGSDPTDPIGWHFRQACIGFTYGSEDREHKEQ